MAKNKDGNEKGAELSFQQLLLMRTSKPLLGLPSIDVEPAKEEFASKRPAPKAKK